MYRAPTAARMAGLIGGAWGGGGGMRNGFADEEGKPREGEAAGDVVNHVDLAEIQAGLQGLQRQVHLEDDRFAIGRGDFVGLDGLGFIDLRRALDKFDAGEDAHGVTRRLRGRGRFGRTPAGP